MGKDKNKDRIDLESMERKNIHSVPDGYFDKLPYSIQQKIAEGKKPWFANLQWSPMKYALASLVMVLLSVFIYLIIPKEEQQISRKDTIGIKKDTLTKKLKKNDQEVIPVPPNNNTVAVDQPKNRKDSSDNSVTIVSPEKLGSPESYLAELSTEDIQEYLDLYEQEDFQTEEFLQD